MSRIFLFLLFCIFLQAKEISVASYNVENLFDNRNDGNEYREFKQSRWRWYLANKKLKKTLKAITFIDADVIALQEVENKSLMKTLAHELKYKYYAFTKPKGSPVGVGVLSRYPIIYKKSHYAGIKKTRDFLETIIEVDGEKFALWVVHFPTQKYGFKRRLKVAKSLKKALQNSKEKEYIVAGDFNTGISSKSVVSKVFGPLQSKKGHYDPWASLPYHKRYSHSYFKTKSALDRMILSEDMFDGKHFEYKDGSFGVIKGFLATKKGYPKRWKNGKGYSDHFPIYLKLNFGKKEAKKTHKVSSISHLYSLKEGSYDVLVKNATLIYKNNNGGIISDGKRGVYAYKCTYGLKLGYSYDILVKSLKDYKGSREVVALEVLKENGRVEDIASYFSSLKNVKENSVLDKVVGEYKDGVFASGKYRLKVFDKTKKLKEGKVKLEKVRVAKFKGKLELIIEERECRVR